MTAFSVQIGISWDRWPFFGWGRLNVQFKFTLLLTDRTKVWPKIHHKSISFLFSRFAWILLTLFFLKVNCALYYFYYFFMFNIFLFSMYSMLIQKINIQSGYCWYIESMPVYMHICIACYITLFLKIYKLNWDRIHLLYSSLILKFTIQSILIDFYSHHHNQFLNTFIILKRNSFSINSHSLFLPTTSPF